MVSGMLFSSTKTFAQQQAVDKLAQAMTDSLSYLQLTAEQKTQALDLNKTAASSLIELGKKAKQDTSLKGKALVQQVMGVMKTRNEALTKIFTPDQQKLYQQHKIQQLADLQTKMMTTQLDLTEQQVPKVYQINLEETGEMMQDVEKLKASKGKFQKMKAAKELKSDSKSKDKSLKKILTEVQYAEYEKNKEAMHSAMKEKMKERKN
jgi:hypothetical protein